MKQIVSNHLLEFWDFLGTYANTFVKKETYSVIDDPIYKWPNRVFNSITENQQELLNKMEQGVYPNVLVLTEQCKLPKHQDISLRMTQNTMVLPMNDFNQSESISKDVELVTTDEQAITFAKIVEESFGYTVSIEMIQKIYVQQDKIKLFLGKDNDEIFTCGMLFLDDYGNAGLHMIGTIKSGRKKGLGKAMTQKLLQTASEHQAQNCILHASKLGEGIYQRLGFTTVGEMYIYAMSGENVRYKK